MWSHSGHIDRLTFAGLRGGGKGGGSSQSYPTPTILTDPVNGKSFVSYTNEWGTNNAQDQLNAEIASRQADEKAASDAATAAASAKSASDEATFQTNKTNAYNTGQAAIDNYFRQQGVDPTKYEDTDIHPALSAALQGITDLDPNPMAAFPSTLGQTILNNITSGSRTRASNALTTALPTTYGQTNLQYSAIDPYVESTIASQFDPLTAQLKNAFQRGTLTQGGYDAALDALSSDRTSATSQVRNIGQGIIDKDRQSLSDYISGAQTNVGNMTQGALDAFDPSTYISGASDMVNRSLSSLGGDITTGVGSTKFADLNTLLNLGGSVQGANSGATSDSGDQTLPVPQDPNVKRGLGSQGAF